MIPDTRVNASTWQNVYALTEITVGAPLVIVNKSPKTAPVVWLGTTAPAEDALQPSGVPLVYGVEYYVEAGALGCWIHSAVGEPPTVAVNVQNAG